MDKIIFILLALFPLGQLLKFDRFLLFDLVILVAALYAIIYKLPKPKFFTHINAFLLTATFSYLLFASIDTDASYLTGFLYLVRIFGYLYFLVFAYNLKGKAKYINYLLVVSIISAIFGWIQYFIWPDLTSLKFLGWDDHLLRMVGTFLDPTFLALIIIFGIVISIYKKNDYSLNFLTLSLAFTYSRVSFLILLLILLLKKKYLSLILFAIAVLVLPKNIGEGTTLSRTTSGINKLQNYTETISIIKKYPLFGVGYNNLCFVKQKYISSTLADSHSCSGSDSSILFLLSTTGIIGLISFLNMIINIARGINKKYYSLCLIYLSVFIHSLFANSLFYPFILFYLILLTVSILRSEVNN